MRIKDLTVKPYRIIICGGRHFDDYAAAEMFIDSVIERLGADENDIEIVSGGCEGADKIGEYYAQANNIKLSVFQAEWNKFGKAAGPIRNSKMVSYASESEHPIVIAFTSPSTKGTNDTISKANRMGVPVYRADYINEGVSLNLFEGVRQTTNGFDFDWNSDEEEDIVMLTKRSINFTSMDKNTRYFGYRINQNSSKNNKFNFLHYIKTEDGCADRNVTEMIERSVEEFKTNNVERYKYIIPVASSSKLTEIIANKLADAFNSSILKTEKLGIENLKINTKKVEEETKPYGKEYAEKLVSFINKRYILPQKKTGRFSMRYISPKYRKFVLPMFKFKTNSFVLDNNDSVLIVDENITTGESVRQVISLIRDTGFNGKIDIFTLISNR